MKKSNLILFAIVLIVIGFFAWVAYRNEKTQIYTPEEKINIKQPPEIVVPVDNATQGKG